MLSFQRLHVYQRAIELLALATEIVRGEAMESAASLDVLKLRQLVQPSTYQRGIQWLESIVAMLTEML